MTELLPSLTSPRRPNSRNPLRNLRILKHRFAHPTPPHSHFSSIQMRQEHSAQATQMIQLFQKVQKAGKSERKDGGKEGDGGARKAGREKGTKEETGDRSERA